MIYPDRFPENQKFDNSKEKEFYIRFRRELPADWDMFYSFKFKMPGIPIREIDYIIISPFGVFIIELKNAKFKFQDSIWWIYDSRERRWKPHKKHHYSGPIEQMLSGIDGFAEFLKINHHEVSPVSEDSLSGAVFLNKNEAAQVNRQIKGYKYIIFHRELEKSKLDDIIINLARRIQVEHIDKEQREILRELILLNGNYVPGYKMRREEQRKVLFALTREQLLAMEKVKSTERILISGVPGSGKTLLALRALEIANFSNWKTLFVCPTNAMANQFKNHTENLNKLTILTFHDLAEWKQEDKFDIIILEESQSFPPDELGILDSLLKEGIEKGRWVVFLDEGQSADRNFSYYWQKYNPEVERLSLNIRNPREIFETACILGRKSMGASAIPDAVNVKFLSYTDKSDEVKKLYELVDYGVDQLGLEPEEIVILSLDNYEDTAYPSLLTGELQGSAKYHIEEIEDGKVKEGKIGFSRISQFVGLETSYVILTGVKELKNEKMNNWYYIALTRSNYAAAVLFDAKLKEEMEELYS